MIDPYIALLAGFGAVLFWLLNDGGGAPAPLEHLELTEHLTEFVVIVALMGAGLKLDRPLAWALMRALDRQRRRAAAHGKTVMPAEER